VTDDTDTLEDDPRDRDGEGYDIARELEGLPARGQQAAYLDIEDLRQPAELTDTALYEGELETGAGAGRAGAGGGSEPLELLTELELRAGETDNPDIAAEEGLTYVPPSDPPVVPGSDGSGPVVAAGFGVDAMDEEYDEDHHTTALPAEDEMAARVREALRADATTSDYADRIAIGTRDGTVALRGVADDLDDTDNLVAVAERVTGVEEVIDEIEVAGMDREME